MSAKTGVSSLLPCPCCGRLPQREPVQVKSDEYNVIYTHGVVICRGCGLRMETCHGQQEAEERWNTRTTPPVMEVT